MDSDDLIEYARRASQLGTCWARLEYIRRQSECLAGQVRQSKLNLKAAMLVPTSIQSAQTLGICDESTRETSYRTTELALNILSETLTGLCIVSASNAHRAHALGLRPLAAACGLKNITPGSCTALAALDEATEFVETQLLAVERLVDQATCRVNEPLADAALSSYRE